MKLFELFERTGVVFKEERSFDEWVELTALAASQDEEELMTVVMNSDEDTALAMYAKEVALKVGTPADIATKVGFNAAEHIQIPDSAEHGHRIRDPRRRDEWERDNEMPFNESEGQAYGVFSRGGSIGSKNDKPIATFNTKEEAKTKARSLRKGLTQGEKKYYKMGYVVRPVQKEAVNEKAPLITVTVAGYRGVQNPQAAHKLKVFMKNHKGSRAKRQGDSWDWEIAGVPKEEMEGLLTGWFGHLEDISVSEIDSELTEGNPWISEDEDDDDIVKTKEGLLQLVSGGELLASELSDSYNQSFPDDFIGKTFSVYVTWPPKMHRERIDIIAIGDGAAHELAEAVLKSGYQKGWKIVKVEGQY